MATNNIVEILALQNQIAEMEKAVAPLRKTNPNHPELRQFDIDLAYNKGKLDAYLQVAEDFSKI